MIGIGMLVCMDLVKLEFSNSINLEMSFGFLFDMNTWYTKNDYKIICIQKRMQLCTESDSRNKNFCVNYGIKYIFKPNSRRTLNSFLIYKNDPLIIHIPTLREYRRALHVT